MAHIKVVDGVMTLDSILCFLLIGAFLALFYGPWQEVCTAFARQIMFEQRDKLFDLAHAGEISFESDYYRRSRASLNAAIRFCHEMTLARLVYFEFCHVLGFIDVDTIVKKKEAEQGHSVIRAKIARLNYVAFRAMAISMMARSLLCVSLALALLPLILVYFWWVGFFSSLVSLSRKVTVVVAQVAQVESGDRHPQQRPRRIR